ncbi:MAG: hypothetical protein ACTS6J_24195 [Burkholderiales bacterium]
MVLNASFNENESAACKSEEALDCFLGTKMDSLVMGAWVESGGERGRATTRDMPYKPCLHTLRPCNTL